MKNNKVKHMGKLPNRTIPEYGQCQNTDTLNISKTINPKKICLMNKIFIII